jgi:hypothetical protein
MSAHGKQLDLGMSAIVSHCKWEFTHASKLNIFEHKLPLCVKKEFQKSNLSSMLNPAEAQHVTQ